MRRIILIGGVLLALVVGAGSAAAETVRDTLMLRAKDSQARIVSIGGQVYHIGSKTQFVFAGRTRFMKPGQKLTLADLDVPESKGAVVPAGEPGIRVKYEAEVIGDRRELGQVLVYPKGSRAH